MSDNFDIPVESDHDYKFFVGFAGEFIVLGLQDLEAIPVLTEAKITRIETAKFLPYNTYTALRSRVDGKGGEAVHISYFDDVYVSGPELGMDGDVNVDGQVDLADIILILKSLVGTDGSNVWSAGDINEDGAIGLSEVVFVLDKISSNQ
ncbi:MAG: hypothetical protein GY702_13220 [Desulfobulbaceae bacterium]|nr:hypothetical protein [Desulfobulbaceae bacterium]